MFNYLTMFLLYFRPCFRRQATFSWFVIVFVGLMLREDTYGVTSIVRALILPPKLYEYLLHFFHSTALDLDKLLVFWWRWMEKGNLAYKYNGNFVLLGDHTKNPKDGRKMPAVATLHQESETSSKPSYFRGHNWGCISMLTGTENKIFSTPLWAQIHQPLNIKGVKEKKEPITIRMVSMALYVAKNLNKSCTLVLDAYFSAAPVFEEVGKNCKTISVNVLTRAKKNVVAYCDPVMPKKRRRGRPAKYGKKIYLFKKFTGWEKKFIEANAMIYGKEEKIRYYNIPLLWRTFKGKVLFIWAETSRGKMILMSSDLKMDPIKAIELYCYRIKIETVFSVLKNIFGVNGYHFWSSYLLPQSRAPKKNKKKRISLNPEKTRKTLHAIEIFYNIQIMVVGLLQVCCMRYSKEVSTKADTWLRTFNSKTPSEFMAKKAMSKVFFKHFCISTENPIMDLIREKQKQPGKGVNYRISA